MAKSLSPNITKIKNKTAFKIVSAARVLGVVDCKSCLKPRCIYSLSALSQMKPPPPPIIPNNHDNTMPPVIKEEIKSYRAVAKDMLRDAMESTIFVCGIKPLGHDDPMYDIFQCDPSLECNTHIEADFYTPHIWSGRKELC